MNNCAYLLPAQHEDNPIQYYCSTAKLIFFINVAVWHCQVNFLELLKPA